MDWRWVESVPVTSIRPTSTQRKLGAWDGHVSRKIIMKACGLIREDAQDRNQWKKENQSRGDRITSDYLEKGR